METEVIEEVTSKPRVVTTIDGGNENIKDCVKIVGNYYLKGVQAIQIGSKWYPKNSSVIFYDYETKQHVLKNKKQHIIMGIVGTEDDGKFIYGEFTSNPYTNCMIWHTKNGCKTKDDCIDYRIPKNLGLIEHVNEGVWASESFFSKPEFDPDDLSFLSKPVRTIINNLYQCNKDSFVKLKEYHYETNPYNIEDSNTFKKVSKLYNEYQPDLTKDVKRVAKMMGDMSFGVEIEAKKGNIPTHLMNQFGVIICKDGSIHYTPEFVTVPLTGAKGLQTLQNLFTELNKRCTTDYSCSLHYHFGSIRKDREFLVALYKMYCDVQKELHTMLPYYKTDPKGIKKDDKNYCQFLDKSLVMRHISSDSLSKEYKDRINKAAGAIQTWVLEGKHPGKDFNRKNKRHPNGNSKWMWTSRYFSLNLLNMFTSNRNTVEYRAHHAVLSPTKALNWFFICASIIKYAEANSARIIMSKETFTLGEVVNYYKDTHKTAFSIRMSDYLNAYIKHRQEFFTNALSKGDRVVESDYIETEYEFVHNGMKDVF